MIPIPSKSTREYKTDLSSDLFGNINRTKNIDFNKRGYLKLAPRATVLYSADQDADFDTVQAIAADEDTVYVITTDRSFASTLSDQSSPLSFSELSNTNAPSFGVQSDAAMYQGLLHVSGTTTVNRFSGGTGGTWSNPEKITGLSSSYPHPLCVSEHQNYLAVGNGNTVRLYNTSYSLITTLTLPSEYVVTWIRWRQSLLYIGTRNVRGGEAKMFIWNGSGTAAQTAYGAQCEWIFSGCEYDGSMAVVTSNGLLMRFNGGGFDTLAELPIWHTQFSWTSNSSEANINGRVASRGMAASGDTLYINLDGSPDLLANGRERPGPYLVNQPGGLCVYDPKVGFYHKAGYNYERYTNPTLTFANSQFIATAGHTLVTGDPVYMSAVGSLTGVTVGTTYFAIVDSNEAFRLALSPVDAVEERAITIGGSLGVAVLSLDSRKSVGSTYVDRSGPILVMGAVRTNIFYGSEVFFAGSTQDETHAQIPVLMSFGMGYNIGSFITPKIPTSQIKDTWRKIISFFGELITESDKIVIKYRLKERPGLPTPYAELTWTSETTFTVDTNTYDFKSVEEGDEIEITGGAAAGYTAHITDIDSSSSTYTVTIDESLPVSNTNVSSFFVDNWKKLQEYDSTYEDNDDGIGETNFDEGAKSKWAQLKVELRGFGTSIEGTDVINGVSEKSN